MTRPAADAPSDPRPTLTHGLRGLVWGISSEVAVVSSLARRIDRHVAELNAARAELAERLERLDALRAATEDVRLTAFLARATTAPLPRLDEHFPERLYGG